MIGEIEEGKTRYLMLKGLTAVRRGGILKIVNVRFARLRFLSRDECWSLQVVENQRTSLHIFLSECGNHGCQYAIHASCPLPISTTAPRTGPFTKARIHV